MTFNLKKTSVTVSNINYYICIIYLDFSPSNPSSVISSPLEACTISSCTKVNYSPLGIHILHKNSSHINATKFNRKWLTEPDLISTSISVSTETALLSTNIQQDRAVINNSSTKNWVPVCPNPIELAAMASAYSKRISIVDLRTKAKKYAESSKDETDLLST
ncbi:unnamed protein product [Ceratitis capitata]|uniref:(Mediterranean fruit fly) hypothetical protein n=1 Tax=Ceratitis capitata TaxID=7213 RepID=A0A811UCL4_CERCA|nr:unnamed protein product [Ceratitis capitata]